MEIVVERIRVFENYLDYAKKIKKLLEKNLSSFELFVFGSVVKGNFSVGLSDIDIAVVSDEFKDRNKKLEIYDLLFSEFFSYPFEFHLLTKDKWNFYKRFVKEDLVKI